MMNVLVVFSIITCNTHCVLCVFVFNEYVCLGRMVSIEASLYVHLGRRSDLGHRCLDVSCFYISMYRYVIHILAIYILMYISIHFTNVICIFLSEVSEQCFDDRIRIRILFEFQKMTEYEYKYYSAPQKRPNTNTNIIRLSKNDRIRIRILLDSLKTQIIFFLYQHNNAISEEHSFILVFEH